ncbi:MAG TPA: SCP2 sterol-binding domain-containing protein [Polyangiales bacterium]|jgi:putative sterol carrier protein|nr:SCP2 sterol-binding domain-containing protein [Polyangiales bacterium]
MSQASEIGHALKGRSDDEILAWVRSVGGSAVFLKQAFWGMKEAFHAERAEGQSALIRWDIATPERSVVTYELEVSDGECTVSRGARGNPSVTLAMGLADFLRLVTGSLDAQVAVADGKLKVSGDMELANQLSVWFQETV